ncbi:unnamed protein product [Oppiella nova]|uniref:Ig-like domain-containing protein n=1 Tax=Oppiella nova TaxID=334625 RepID=A0A7R9QDK6_9ACAR|nr:unnamed protein product [Oppiella nova]CAG2163748.1 unnamed protein product [Oppiella nova]
MSAVPEECGPRLVSTNEPNVTIHKKIGDRHQFQCRALGVPAPHIHWILPNGDVLNDTSNTIHYQLKLTGSLRLFHLKPRDSGVYRCVAQNTFGSVMAAMTLMIDNIDLHLYAMTVASNYVTLVWNGTGRNSFHEYHIIYKVMDDRTGDDEAPNTTTTRSLSADSPGKWQSEYESVTVNHVLRSYSLTHLEPNTKYWICLTVRDADAHNGYVQLSCTTVVTKAATHTTATPLKTSESTNFALAITLSATILLVFFVYFVYMGLKRYRIHRQYEIPAPKLSNGANNNPGVHNDPNLPHIPLENIKSPLIKHMRH